MSSWQAKSTRALGRNIMEVDGEAAWVKLYEPWSIPHLEEAVSYLRAARNQYGSVLAVIEPFIDNPLPATVRRYLSQHQRDFSFSEIILIKRSVLLRGVDVISAKDARKRLVKDAALAKNDWSNRIQKYLALFQFISGVLEEGRRFPYLATRLKALRSIRAINDTIVR